MLPRPRRTGRGPAAHVDGLTRPLGEAPLAAWSIRADRSGRPPLQLAHDLRCHAPNNFQICVPERTGTEDLKPGLTAGR